MQGQEIEAIMASHFDDDFVSRALRAVFQAHKVAYEEATAQFQTQEAENALPYMRRAKLEGYLRDTASRSGMTALVQKSAKSSWWHTEVRSGPLVLTASSVQSPCGPVDPSEFRLTLAQDNALYLWDEPGDPVPADAPLYMLLLHSRNRGDDRIRAPHLPGSAYLAFPAPRLADYVHRINLFERYPSVVDSHLPQECDGQARRLYMNNARRLA